MNSKLTTPTRTLWGRLEIAAFGIFCFLLGIAFDQGQANMRYLHSEREQIIGDVCKRSDTPECSKARATLDEFPIQQTAPPKQ